MVRGLFPWLVTAIMATSALAVARAATPEADSAIAVRARAAQVAFDAAPVATATPASQTVQVAVRNGTTAAILDVEIARTEAERERGLMDRTSLPDDGGMLFLFPRDAGTGFWMKDTLIPLDIAFVNSQLAIVTIRHGVPLDLTVLTADAPYRYVIETNVGWFAAHGFGPGSTMQLPPGLPAAQ